MADGDVILVLGATSLVGRFLMPRLAAQGVSAIALSRQARPPRPGVLWALGDLGDPASLAAVGPVTQVFSLSPVWLLSDGALAALRDLGMRRLVAFSSTSRFTKAASASEKERAVAAALAEGEARVEAFCHAHDVGFTLIRPTLIYAEGQDANVSRLAALIRRFGVMPLPGGGRGLRQPVHADDLAALALTAMARPATDRAYDAPGGETLTYRVMVERIFAGMGRPPLILPIPLPAMRLAYALARPWLKDATAQVVDRVGEDLTFDPGPAVRDLGWAPRPFRPRF